MKKEALTIFLLLFNLGYVFSQQTIFFDATSNIPGGLIDKVFEDGHGNICLVGKSGVIKFDGIDFSRLVLERDPSAKISPQVKNMYLDSLKTYYGTQRGLICVGNYSDSIYRVPLQIGDTVISDGYISSVVKTKNPDVLIATVSGYGLVAIDTKTDKTVKSVTDSLNSIVNTVYPGVLFIDSQNFLWAFSAEGDFNVVSLNKMKRRPIRFGYDCVDKIVFTCAAEIPDSKDIIFGTLHDGIMRYNRKSGTLSRVENVGSKVTGRINSIVCLNDSPDGSHIMVGSEDFGLLDYNDVTRTIKPTALINNRIDLHNCKIHHIYQDKNSNIWAVAYHKGVLLIPKNTIPFRNIDFNNLPGNINFMLADFRRTLWIGTDGGGIYKITHDSVKQSFTSRNTGMPNNSVISADIDRNYNLWFSTYEGGLSILNLNNEEITNFSVEPEFQKIQCIRCDKNSDLIYLGTLGSGTIVVDINTKQVVARIKYPQWVYNIFQSSDQKLYINHLVFENLKLVQSQSLSELNHVHINATAEDNDGNIYIGTDRWLYKYNPKTDSLKKVENQNSPGIIKSMVFDDFDCLWYVSDNKLVRYNPKKQLFTSFDSKDGLGSSEFYQHSLYKSASGAIFAGTINGLAIVKPFEKLPERVLNTELYFSDLWVSGEKVDFQNRKGTCDLDAPVEYAKILTLAYDKNMFSVNLRIPVFTNPHRINFRYRLKNFSDKWYYASSRNISFTNLPEGEYLLEAEAYYDVNPENKAYKSLKIIVLPPWYRTWWAYLSYFLVFALISFLLYLHFRNALILKRQKQENNQKEMRLQMFTNLSHEIRTPLSLVTFPLNSLIETEKDKSRRGLLCLMDRNLKRVKSQLDRIMDIRKIDNNNFVMNLENVNVTEFMADIIKSFDRLSLLRNINLTFDDSCPGLVTAFDRENFDKVIFNILSSAFKFTPDGGFISIKVSKTENNVFWAIENSGKHINKNDLENVFTCFYQGEDSTFQDGYGIGLHLAKMITEAHDGTISVDNTIRGVVFTISLPLKTVEPKVTKHVQDIQTERVGVWENKNHYVETPLQEDAIISKNRKLRKIVLIDNDSEWTDYIVMSLSDKFQTEVCSDPNNFLNVIQSVEPDAVITDISLSGISGYDICKKIRQTPETSLLPLIVLSSVADDESRRRCMELGVDSFLSKPVSLNLLKSTILNAINIRTMVKNKVLTDMQTTQMSVDTDSADNKLLKKVMDCITSHVTENNYGVNELSADIGISRVHLNRKLKELLNITPLNLIRAVRMKNAAKLLVDNGLISSEVAYKLGFSTQSYFSGLFKDYFGITPKEFAEKYSKEENREAYKKLLNADITSFAEKDINK